MNGPMIDMYDLPTESELAAVMESAKKNKKVGEIDTKTIFPFWSDTSKSKVLSDKTGVVKPNSEIKTKTTGDVQSDWEDFLKNIKTSGNKPVEVNEFGSFVVKSYAAKPDPKKVAGSIKAMKQTTVKELSGKSTVTTEELAVGKIITNSHAQKTSKDNTVGIVKPIKDKSWFEKNPNSSKMFTLDKPTNVAPFETKTYGSYTDTIKSDVKNLADYTTKDELPGIKKASNTMKDMTGAVKAPKVNLASKKTK